MDLPKYCDSGGSGDGPDSQKNTIGHSTEDIALSLGKHLLQGDPGSGDVVDSQVGLECGSWSGRLHGVSSVEAHGDGEHRAHGRLNTDADGQQFDRSVGMTTGSAMGSDEEVDINAAEHPRLNTRFYEELRQKYPRAFKRRGSSISDTASVTDVPPYRPKDSKQTIRDYTPKLTRSRCSSQPDLLSMGYSPLVGRRFLASPKFHEDHGESVQQGYESSDKENSYVHSEGDKCIVSHGDARIRGLDHVISPHHRRASSPAVSTGSSQSANDKISVRERLRRNSETLKKLLSANPLKNKLSSVPALPGGSSDRRLSLLQPDVEYRVRKTTPMEQIYENFTADVVDHNVADAQIRAYIHLAKEQTSNPSDFHSGDHPLDVRLTPSHMSDPSLPPAISKPVQSLPFKTAIRLALVDKNNGKNKCKRFSSPDSQNDSAIETGSVHSSPSSDPYTRSKLSQTNGAAHNATELNTKKLALVPSGCRTPKLGRFKQQEQIYENLAEEGLNETFNSKDSDQDSGISQPTVRLRQDSESSGETDQEPRSTQPQAPVRRKKASASKNQPLRGDHSLQLLPGAQQQGALSDAEVEEWMKNGVKAKQIQQRRAVSVNEIGQNAAIHAGRVHFQDDLYQNIPFQERAVSQPNLNRNNLCPPGWSDPHNDSTDSDGSSRCSSDRVRHHYSKSAPQSNLRHSQSEQVLCRKGLIRCSPSDLPEEDEQEPVTDPVVIDIESSIQKSRSRSSTPCEVIYAACGDVTELDVSMYQASPAIVLPPRGPIKQSDHTVLSELQTAHEFGYNSKLYDDINKPKVKTSRKPWKKKKGSYTPDVELTIDNVESPVQIQTTLSHTGNNVRISGQATSEVTTSKPPKAPRSAGRKPPSPRSASGTDMGIHNNYASPRVGESDRWRAAPVENVYEDVEAHSRRNSPLQSSIHRDDLEQDFDVYTAVKKSARSRTRSASVQLPSGAMLDDPIVYLEAPPLPYRGYGGMDKYTDLSGSRPALFSHMDGIRDSARKKWQQLRRAVSLERVDQNGRQPESGWKRSPSIKSLVERLSFRKKGSQGRGNTYRMDKDVTKARRPSSTPVFGRHHLRSSSSMTALDSVDKPQHFRSIGKLRQLNPDGTQVIELHKPPHGPYGFFIARGSAKYKHGVFISRLNDGLPEHFFAGLLSVGDEILEINGIPLKSMTLETVYDLMAERTKLIMKVLPYLMRTENKN